MFPVSRIDHPTSDEASDELHGVLDATRFPPQRWPTVVQFPVNDICNSRCQMCNIWQMKRDRELTTEDVRRIFSQQLFQYVTHVGINGGEPTLRQDLHEIAAALHGALPRLKGLSLITNALSYRLVTTAIEALSQTCRQHRLFLDVMVSIDGIEEVHDRVRGRSGNFDTASQVLDFIQRQRLADQVRIGSTIVKDNIYDLENIDAWARGRGLYARYRVAIPHQRLYNQGYRGVDALSPDELFHLLSFLDYLYYSYERRPQRRAFYRSLRDQLAYGRRRQVGCQWKGRGVTVTSRGELMYCAIKSPILGDLLKDQGNDLYWGQQSVLQDIQARHCDACIHDYDGPAIAFETEAAARQQLPSSGRAIASRIAALPGVRTVLQYVNISRRRLSDKADRVSIRSQARAVSEEPLQLSRLPPRVLLCGWYGTETLGDRCILAAIAKHASCGGALDVELASLEPYISRRSCAQLPGLPIAAVWDVKDSVRRLSEGCYRAVIIAGGPLMTPIRECLDLHALFVTARRVGAAAVVAGCGIGPLASGIIAEAIQGILRMATAVLVRDSASAQTAARFVARHVTPLRILDPALLFAREQFLKFSAADGKPSVLLALRAWPASEYGQELHAARRAEISKRYEAEACRLVSALIAAVGEDGILPFCMHKLAVGGDDRQFYRRLLHAYPRLLRRVDQRHRSLMDELRQFAAADRVFAMRFHSIVLSIAFQQPFLALDYTRGGKIAALLRDLQLDSQQIALEEFDGRSAAERLLSVAAKPLDLTESIREAARALQSVFESLAAGDGTW